MNSKNQRTAMVDQLNKLLASYAIHYQNLRALHWNIKGSDFFELHEKYEELYQGAQEAVDELAEWVRTFGATPQHKYSDYLKNSAIQEIGDISDGKEGVRYVVKAHDILLQLEQEILSSAAEDNDESTSSVISDLSVVKEKANWMLRAWLGE